MQLFDNFYILSIVDDFGPPCKLIGHSELFNTYVFNELIQSTYSSFNRLFYFSSSNFLEFFLFVFLDMPQSAAIILFEILRFQEFFTRNYCSHAKINTSRSSRSRSKSSNSITRSFELSKFRVPT